MRGKVGGLSGVFAHKGVGKLATGRKHGVKDRALILERKHNNEASRFKGESLDELFRHHLDATGAVQLKHRVPLCGLHQGAVGLLLVDLCAQREWSVLRKEAQCVCVVVWWFDARNLQES